MTLEQHEQRVYEPAWILAELKNAGFQVEVYTDFTQAGICEEKSSFISAGKREVYNDCSDCSNG